MTDMFTNDAAYDVDWAIARLSQDERMKWVFFWGHRPKHDKSISASCLSQWWEGPPFQVEDDIYPTAEHWMMAEKARLFNNDHLVPDILSAANPGKVKALGRKVTGFDQNIWTENRYRIVKEGNFHRFSQHAELGSFLVGTNDRVIVESSPVDKIWGVGLAANDDKVGDPSLWQGLNLLGFALMEVRDRLNTGL